MQDCDEPEERAAKDEISSQSGSEACQTPRMASEKEPQRELKQETSNLSMGSWDLPALTADFNRQCFDLGGRIAAGSGQGVFQHAHATSGRELQTPTTSRSGFSIMSSGCHAQQLQQQQQELNASVDLAADLRKVTRWLHSRSPGGDLENSRLQKSRWIDTVEVPEEGQSLLTHDNSNGPATSRTFVLGCVVRLRGSSEREDRRHEKVTWRDQLIEALKTQESAKKG